MRPRTSSPGSRSRTGARATRASFSVTGRHWVITMPMAYSASTPAACGEKSCARCVSIKPRRPASCLALPRGSASAPSESGAWLLDGGVVGFGHFHQRFDFQPWLPERELIRRTLHIVIDDAHRQLRQHFLGQFLDQLAISRLQVQPTARQRYAPPLRWKLIQAVERIVALALAPHALRQLTNALVLVTFS